MRLLPVAAIAALIASSPAFAGGQTDPKDIVTTAVEAGSFQTLTAALGAVDLVTTLQGDGPFTVFAPSDAAFAKLDQHVLADLLKPENKARLTSILTYHVVPGRIEAKDVVQVPYLTTINGQRASLDTSSGVRIAGANVSATDIACSNGVIHVIDSVLLPAELNLVELASGAGTFKTLLAAAKAAGLVDALVGSDDLTILAPTDEAFAALGADTLEALLEPRNKQRLASILKYHVIPGRVYSDSALAARRATTLNGAGVSFGIANGRLTAGGANVIANDLDASNGVVHVIDAVLLPPVPQGRLMIGYTSSTPGAALAAQLRLDAHASAVVTSVTRPESGLEKYDVITKVNGAAYSQDAIAEAKAQAGYAGTVRLTIYRKGRKQTIDANVGVDPH